MTPEEPLDDDMFINTNFLANRPIQKAGVKTAYDQSSFFRIGSITGRCPAESGASKPQPATSSEPKDSVQLSPKGQAQASGDVDYDGDSH